ncbi:hypothetical protein [Sinorhizobium sp. Sb3]|uniref:hypothetical protein n=1 Tax=Sinorhizobium/Ensifer group TaxID=227292 RepID=UPI00071D3A89|nr:hypothetical protein [Sinorhizobium sp. Sb3]KSV75161.1 hypothetical protein N183_22760 [Sinorhizobium sp. Sb3]
MLKNEGPVYVLYLVVPVLAAFLIRETYSFIRSLRFYKGNGWDFTVDIGPKMYKGESTDPDFEMSPREKLWDLVATTTRSLI